MSNFRGYYFKIGDCKFNNPFPKKDGYEVMPHLVQTTESGRVASGKMIIKELPHRPTKLVIQFPVMKPTQFREYYRHLDSMSLDVEYYNEASDSYENGVFYHGDLKYKPVIFAGEQYIEFEQFSLIEL